jgi:hypothetical protein
MSPRDELDKLLTSLGEEERALVRYLAEDLASDGSGARSDLFAVMHELADEQVQQLLGVARVMALPIDETIAEDSEVVTPAFAAEFRARLQAHHATHTTPMDRLSFENAFLAASRAAGRATSEAPSRTTRFFDVTVDGEQTALKTEGAKSMKADRLHISKLSEAAWIQDMRSGRTRQEKTLEFLDDFSAAVDRIFVLRYYQSDPAPHYELVEIPTEHFGLLRDVPPREFNSDAPRIAIADDEGPIMEFRLDRSDSKITIGKIQKNRCIVHGDWRLAGLDSTADAPTEEAT